MIEKFSKPYLIRNKKYFLHKKNFNMFWDFFCLQFKSNISQGGVFYILVLKYVDELFNVQSILIPKYLKDLDNF